MRSLSRAETAQCRNSTAALPLTAAPALIELSALRGSAAEDGPFDSIAHELMRALQCDDLLITSHNGGDSVLLFADQRSDPEAIREMQRCASWAAVSGATAETWYVANSAIGKMLIAPIFVETGLITITALFETGSGSIDRAQAASAQTLRLVQPFFKLWSRQHRSELRLRGLVAAVNRGEVGLALVARDGKLLFANTACEKLMADGDGVRRMGQQVCGASLADTLRLQAAIEHAVASDRLSVGDPATATPVLAIARRNRRPLLAAIASERGDRSGPTDDLAIVYLFDPETDLRPVLEPVCKLYALSPVEARLASLLAGGISLADASAQMHVREQTARSYLKQIFQKTDTNRQAELVWLMLRSSVRIGPASRTAFF